MNSVELYLWAIGYLVVAVIFGGATLVVADHPHTGEGPGLTAQSATAAVVGALWPVMVVGLAQLLILRTAANRLRRQPSTTPGAHSLGHLIAAPLRRLD